MAPAPDAAVALGLTRRHARQVSVHAPVSRHHSLLVAIVALAAHANAAWSTCGVLYASTDCTGDPVASHDGIDPQCATVNSGCVEDPDTAGAFGKTSSSSDTCVDGAVVVDDSYPNEATCNAATPTRVRVTVGECYSQSDPGEEPWSAKYTCGTSGSASIAASAMMVAFAAAVSQMF